MYAQRPLDYRPVAGWLSVTSRDSSLSCGWLDVSRARTLTPRHGSYKRQREQTIIIPYNHCREERCVGRNLPYKR